MKLSCCRCLSSVALMFLLFSCGGGERQSPQPPAVHQAGVHGILVVSFAPDSADTFPSVGTDSTTVINWLRAACDSAHVKLALKEFPFGTLVNGIGPRRNGDGGNWLYRVNGRMMAKAASSCNVAPSDTVMFFFQ